MYWSRIRSDSASRKCFQASLVRPSRSPQKLSFRSARKCWKCSLMDVIFAMGCKSPFREFGFSSSGQSQLTPSCLLHTRIYVTAQRAGNREQGTGNREQEQGTGNREQGTGNREQGTGNREQGTGNREQGT